MGSIPMQKPMNEFCPVETQNQPFISKVTPQYYLKIIKWDDFTSVISIEGPVPLQNDLLSVSGYFEEKEAAEDWKDFLTCRAKEMKKGAVCLVIIPLGQGMLDILSEEFRQLYLTDTITKDELAQTNIPEYAFRTEADIREPFEIYGETLGLQLLEISEKSVKLYENKDIVACLRNGIYHGIMTGLCKTRSVEKANQICEIYFENLSWKWINMVVYYVSFRRVLQ